MKIAFAWCCLIAGVWCSASLSSQQELSVCSQSASYEDHVLHLADNVVIQYEIGTIMADHAHIESDPQRTELPFKTLSLQGSIVMQMHDQGTLHCDDALLNALTDVGYFRSVDEKNKVLYEYMYVGTQGHQECVALQSQKMEIFLPPLQQTKRKKQQKWQNKNFTVHAFGDVTAKYNDSFVALADRAICTPSFAEKSPKQNYISTLLLLPSSENEGLCRLQHIEGDVINAAKIVFSPPQHMLTFDKPYGIFVVNRKDSMPLVQFSAENLQWDEQQGIFTLQKDIRLQDAERGDLHCDKLATITHTTSPQRKQQLDRIDAKGKISIYFHGTENKFEHTLFCPGTAQIDYTNLISTFQAEAEEAESDMSPQILFKDYIGTIYADRVQIMYERTTEQKIVPKQLILHGNIYIINQAAFDAKNSSVGKQYACAQKLIYTPESGEMQLFGSDDSKVLFFDPLKQVQVSAQQVNVQRNRSDGKESIQGIGQVQFTLNPEEWNRLKARFDIE